MSEIGVSGVTYSRRFNKSKLSFIGGERDKPLKFSNRANREREERKKGEIKKKLADQMGPAGIEMRGQFKSR